MNNCSPLPLKKLPDERNTLPLNVEPLSTLSTTNPKSGETDAVTLPLVIRNTSWDNADCGISKRFLPLPLKAEPLANSILPYANILPVTSIEPVNCAGPMFLNVLDEDTINDPVIVTLPSISVSPIIFNPVLTGTSSLASTMLISPAISLWNWQL